MVDPRLILLVQSHLSPLTWTLSERRVTKSMEKEFSTSLPHFCVPLPQSCSSNITHPRPPLIRYLCSPLPWPRVVCYPCSTLSFHCHPLIDRTLFTTSSSRHWPYLETTFGSYIQYSLGSRLLVFGPCHALFFFLQLLPNIGGGSRRYCSEKFRKNRNVFVSCARRDNGDVLGRYSVTTESFTSAPRASVCVASIWLLGKDNVLSVFNYNLRGKS